MSAERPPAGVEPDAEAVPSLSVRPLGSFAELRSLLVDMRSMPETRVSDAEEALPVVIGSTDVGAEALLERAERLAESPRPSKGLARLRRWLAGEAADSNDSRFRLLVALARALFMQQQLWRDRSGQDVEALRGRVLEIERITRELRQASLALGEAINALRDRDLEAEPRLRSMEEAHDAIVRRTAELEATLARRSGSLDGSAWTINAGTSRS